MILNSKQNLSTFDEEAQIKNGSTDTKKSDTKRIELKSERFKKIGYISILVACVFTLCVFDNYAGIAYAVCMVVIIGGIEKSKLRKNKVDGMTRFYWIALFLMAFAKCMTMSDILQVLDTAMILLLFCGYFFHSFRDQTDWTSFTFVKEIGAFLFGVLFNLMQPVTDVFAFVHMKRFRSGRTDKTNPIFIGILISIPILVVIVSLLASADAVFNAVIGNMASLLIVPNIVVTLIRMGLMTLAAYCIFYSTLLYFDCHREKDKKIFKKKDARIAITIATILSVVYFVFCLIQIVYLFGGKMQLPKGYTYSQYAHEGFIQLMLVSVINLFMVLTVPSLFENNPWLKRLCVFIGTCTYILIASSAMRMWMYISIYALTFLRLFVLWFLIVLGVWFAGLLYKIYHSSFPLFRYALVVITISYTAFTFSNPDLRIAQYDLDRREKTSALFESDMDRYLLYDLSMDALPAFKEHKIFKDYIKNVMVYPHVEAYERSGFLHQVRSFNVSIYHAKQILDH